MLNNTYLNDLEKWVLGEIKGHLEGYKGQDVDPSELAFKLFESENATGSYTCSYAAAKDWINTFFNEMGDEVTHYESEFGEMLNPFDDPEAFQVIIIIQLADRLCSSNNYLNDRWDETITLDDETIKAINKDWE